MNCSGKGYNGLMAETQHPCLACNGQGQQVCHSCAGNGLKKCLTCFGYGQLRWFIQLTIKYTNNRNDYLKDGHLKCNRAERIPNKLIRKAMAQNILSENNLRIKPITNHPDNDINQASANLINEHNCLYSNVKILSQKHDLTVIPITHCKFEWNKELGDFYVYGLDHNVFAPNYPKKCSCTIL